MIDFSELAEAERQGFVIDNYQKADWAIRQIKEEERESSRLVDLYKGQMQELEQKIKRESERLEKATAYLKEELEGYFESVPDLHRVTKTQRKYRLGCGDLVLKQQQPEYKRDNLALLESVRGLGLQDCIVTKEEVVWSELKSRCKAAGDHLVLAESGEVIEGVQVIEREPKFEIK